MITSFAMIGCPSKKKDQPITEPVEQVEEKQKRIQEKEKTAGNSFNEIGGYIKGLVVSVNQLVESNKNPKPVAISDESSEKIIKGVANELDKRIGGEKTVRIETESDYQRPVRSLREEEPSDNEEEEGDVEDDAQFPTKRQRDGEIIKNPKLPDPLYRYYPCTIKKMVNGSDDPLIAQVNCDIVGFKQDGIDLLVPCNRKNTLFGLYKTTKFCKFYFTIISRRPMEDCTVLVIYTEANNFPSISLNNTFDCEYAQQKWVTFTEVGEKKEIVYTVDVAEYNKQQNFYLCFYQKGTIYYIRFRPQFTYFND
ncbi:MAG TPA: hypothetical protein PLK76_01910 [bacterium]|nr:hypothetical protein [bacterium]